MIISTHYVFLIVKEAGFMGPIIEIFDEAYEEEDAARERMSDLWNNDDRANVHYRLLRVEVK